MMARLVESARSRMKSTTCDSVLVTKYGGAAMRRSKPAAFGVIGEKGACP